MTGVDVDVAVKRPLPIAMTGIGAVLAMGAVANTAATGPVQLKAAAAFLAAIAVGEFMRVVLPGDRDAAPLGTAGALAYALVPWGAKDLASHTVAQVLTVTLLGMFLGALPFAAVGRGPRVDYFVRRLAATAVPAAMFRPWSHGTRPLVDLDLGPSLAAAMAAAVALSAVVEAVLAAGARASWKASPYRAVLRDELRALMGIGSAVGATGMLIALATHVMSLWAIPVFCIPLLLTYFSFRRFAYIRVTHLQTVRALSRVTELGGYTDSGHARRVSELAVAVGRDMGMTDGELLDLEYAALMHDIGQLSLKDPIPGGATTLVDLAEQRRIAELGARVIRETGVLDRVAQIVEHQTDPYRRPHERADPTVPLASRIIKAVNAFDDFAAGALDAQAGLDALERLSLGIAYEYDPQVVNALSRVVERAGRHAGR